ncbi:MAG: bis(5'-nucleosyl)-tetraphosphatase (symmetrical) YqeK [Lachnospiraceae bacterium]|nr:bis(5'-nucleosyl)-tetraphosphatase (symmetrical) YqeK [Lachnospiraceae bacterium]MDD6304275.1 bis(5'-nucleosyl)-tetraphosphatase (symmetrical) YqeK [Lachnospiraceae bacterium]
MNERFNKIKKALKKELDKDRYEHTLGVMYTSACLAMANGYDMEKAQLAGLLHDCAKCIPNEKKLKICAKNNIPVTQVEKDNPFLLHAKVGAFLARALYEVEDEEILHAISVHTTGAPAMNTLDKIVFIADYIEPKRDKAANLKEIRKTAFEDLDEALKMILCDTINYLNGSKNDKNIDPMTLETYHYYTGGSHE